MSAIWDFLLAHWSAILLGGVGAYGLRWVIGFVDGKGIAYLSTELEKLRVFSNSTAIGAQIQCDDAIINVLESTLPDVLHTLDEDILKALAAGNIGAINWKQIGIELYAKAKGQIQGGVNDYLKNSSFKDGEALAEMIAKRFFVTQRLASKGVITDPPRAVEVPRLG